MQQIAPLMHEPWGAGGVYTHLKGSQCEKVRWLLHACRKEARKQQLKEAAGNIKSSGKDQQVRSARDNMLTKQTCLGLIGCTALRLSRHVQTCPYVRYLQIWGSEAEGESEGESEETQA